MAAGTEAVCLSTQPRLRTAGSGYTGKPTRYPHFKFMIGFPTSNIEVSVSKKPACVGQL